MIEDSIHKENKTIINTYAYIKAPKYIEWILTNMKGQIYYNMSIGLWYPTFIEW
jgi:hypothetical protein